MDPRVAEMEARGIRRLAHRGAYEAKTFAARSPLAAIPLARLRGHGALLAPDTELLIEGFPRSANSFAVAAFVMAQGRDVKVAHHTHAPGHVLSAVRARCPSLILIREPDESALEVVVARPTRTVRQALRGWVRFYRPLVPASASVVIGAFPDVTSSFGSVIRRVNLRFGTTFAEFAHTDEMVQVCFQAMDAYWRDRVGSSEVLERLVGRPSALREELKDSLRPRLDDPRLAGLRAEANALYRRFASPA